MVFLSHSTHKKTLIAKYATLQRLTPVKYEMYFIVTRISSLRSIDVYFFNAIFKLKYQVRTYMFITCNLIFECGKTCQSSLVRILYKCSDDFPPESTSNFIIPKHVFLCHAHKKPVQALLQISNNRKQKIHVLLGIQMLLMYI